MVLVEVCRQRCGKPPFCQRLHDNDDRPAGCHSLHFIADPQRMRRFCISPSNLDVAACTGLLRQCPCFEKTCRPEPFVDSDCFHDQLDPLDLSASLMHRDHGTQRCIGDRCNQSAGFGARTPKSIRPRWKNQICRDLVKGAGGSRVEVEDGILGKIIRARICR